MTNASTLTIKDKQSQLIECLIIFVLFQKTIEIIFYSKKKIIFRNDLFL